MKVLSGVIWNHSDTIMSFFRPSTGIIIPLKKPLAITFTSPCRLMSCGNEIMKLNSVGCKYDAWIAVPSSGRPSISSVVGGEQYTRISATMSALILHVNFVFEWKRQRIKTAVLVRMRNGGTSRATGTVPNSWLSLVRSKWFLNLVH